MGAGTYFFIAQEPATFRERYGKAPDNATGYGGQPNNAGVALALLGDSWLNWLARADMGGTPGNSGLA